MAENSNAGTDARLVAQERLLNATLAILATRDPGFLEAVRNAVVDTNFSRSDPPQEGASAIQHISFRLNAIQAFVAQQTGESAG